MIPAFLSKPAPATAAPAAPSPYAHRPQRETLRFLVVDDMSTSRGMLVQALDALGCRKVIASAGGLEALRAVRMQTVDLVLSDYQMPGMNGLDLLEEMRAAPRLASVSFMLLTDSTGPDMFNRGRKLGVNGYVHKPYSLSELRLRIEQVMGRI